MQAIIIRKALLKDMDQLLAFEQGVIAAERPFDPTLRPGQIHYYDIHELITADHIELLVAELDGQLIGSGYARIETSKHYLRHAQHAYLGFMYLLPEYRGKGINQRLIAGLREWALSKGITDLSLDVYSENVAAIKAYAKVGFTPYLLNMRMGIGE